MLARTLKFVVISSLKNTINFSLVRTEIAPFDEVKGGMDKAWQFIGSRLRRVYLAGNPALLFFDYRSLERRLLGRSSNQLLWSYKFVHAAHNHRCYITDFNFSESEFYWPLY